MHSLTHFLVSFTILYAFFNHVVPISFIFIFSLLFGVFVDLDIILSPIFGIRGSRARTWFQEPFGMFFFGSIFAFLISQILHSEIFIWLVFLPWASHIFIDYLAIHDVRPLSPFSNKTYHVGFFKPILHKKTLCPRKNCFSEWHFIIVSSCTLILVLIFI